MDKHFDIPKAWSSAQLVNDPDNVFVRFSDAASRDLAAFVKENRSENLDNIDCPEGELPLVRQEMKQFEKLIREMYGFVVIKPVAGLDPVFDTRYTSMLITSMLGMVLPQNAEGTKAVQVYDRNRKRSMKDGGRYHQTHEGGSIHTDNVNTEKVWDYMILSCIHDGMIGGENILCSTVSIHNYLREHAPEALEILCQQWWWEYRGFSDAFYRAPIMFYNEMGEPAMRYLRDYLESAHERNGEPLTRKQRWALDALDSAMEISDIQFRYRMSPGDMLMTNDTQLLHGRTTFVDQMDANGDVSLKVAPKNRLMQRSWVTTKPHLFA